MTKARAGATFAEEPILKWLVAAIGLVMVVGTAGYMLREAAAGPEQPPEIAITVTEVATSGDGFLATIQVANRGGAVAAGVVVEGSLHSGAETVETSTITIDYVPAGSQRGAGLFFQRDPRALDLRLRATGYVDP